MSDDSAEYKKLCLARYLYRNRLIDRELENSRNARRRNTRAKPKTWRQRWKEMYSEDINDYIAAKTKAPAAGTAGTQASNKNQP